MFYLLGVFLSVFLFLILISKKGKTLPDKILAIWLVFVGFTIYDYYSFITGLDLKQPILLALGSPLPILHGPFLFIYTASLTNQLPTRKYKVFLHFVPVIVVYCIFFPFYLLDGKEKIEVFRSGGRGWETEQWINLCFIYISGVVYIVWSLLLLRKHRRSILQQFSDIEKINLNWLRYLILGISTIWIFVFYGNDDLIYGAAVVFIGFIGFYGIKQVGIFTHGFPHYNLADTTINVSANGINRDMAAEENVSAGSAVKVVGFKDHEGSTNENDKSKFHFEEEGVRDQTTIIKEQDSDWETNNEKVSTGSKRKYQKSGLSDTEAKIIHEKLASLMLIEKTFKNPEITLVELSQRLNVHPNILSQVINTIEQKNFYDFINDKRVEEFKNTVSLPQNRKYTLLSLAYECGFNSKTTFNRNFKKSTGLSPSEYLKSIRVEMKE